MGSYAIVSDIHGNLQALTEVWAKLTMAGLTEHTVFNAGDSVAYGPDSPKCIDFIQSHENILSVGGNYDYNVAEYPERKDKMERKWKISRPEKYESIRLASAQISASQRTWLKNLPVRCVVEIEGKAVMLGHYSPIGRKVGLGTWTPDCDLLSIAYECAYDVIIVGHTHTPFVRQAGKTLFINPGTVGRAWGLPPYAAMTIDGNEVRAEILT